MLGLKYYGMHPRGGWGAELGDLKLDDRT